jgi:hypothetical protein
MRLHLLAALTLLLASGCLTDAEDDANTDDLGQAAEEITKLPPPPPPPPVEQLLAPLDPQLTLRRADRLQLTWRDRTTLESGYQVQRKIGVYGSWTTVAPYGALTTGTTAVTTLSGLTPQTLVCARVRAYNGTTSVYSPARCAYTKSSVARRLQRVRLEITTANVADAGTDNRMSVRLNSPPIIPETTTYLPRGNRTFLDLPGDDFVPGQTTRYDLIPPGDLGDLTQIYLEKEGTNGLCIAGLRLIANGSLNAPDGRVLFERQYGDTAATCHWIDSATGFQPALTIDFDELRASPEWQAATAGAWTCDDAVTCANEVFPMELDTLEERLEGVIGHAISATGFVTWGDLTAGEGLHLTTLDRFSLGMELDLQGVHLGGNTHARIRGAIHLTATATPTGTLLGTRLDDVRVGVDASDLDEALVDTVCFGLTLVPQCFVLGDLIESYLEGKIEDRFTPINETVEVPRAGAGCVVLRAPTGSDHVIEATVVSCTDLDDDLIDDAWELAYGLDPNDDADARLDPDGDGQTNLQEFLAGSDPSCRWNPGDPDYCRDCGPCGAGEADCDTDDECTGGLICAQNVGAQYGYPATWDVCACPWAPGDANYCRDCGPCGVGQGDCDADAECAEGTACHSNVGARYGLPADYDVCECALTPGADDYCDVCGPCAVGAGDCDSNVECATGEVCATDVGLAWGYPEATDVCVCTAVLGCAQQTAP